jgi:hypothetical protein
MQLPHQGGQDCVFSKSKNFPFVRFSNEFLWAFHKSLLLRVFEHQNSNYLRASMQGERQRFHDAVHQHREES